MNAPRVNVCIWGCCRNVLLLQVHPDDALKSTLYAATWPLAAAERARGASLAGGMQGYLSCAMGWPLPARHRWHRARRNRSWGWDVSGFMPLGLPQYLLRFAPPDGSRTQCQEKAALGQVMLRASLLLIHFAHFVSCIPAGLKPSRDRCKQLVISC